LVVRPDAPDDRHHTTSERIRDEYFTVATGWRIGEDVAIVDVGDAEGMKESWLGL
jgi:hypothetical protein